jgi:multicomponent Na+:H+ antiporter subunit D
MLVTAAVIVTAAAFYARTKFATPDGVRESRGSLTFWIMLQAIWAALTIIFVGSDLFNLYVALELLTFSAVPLWVFRWKDGVMLWWRRASFRPFTASFSA